MASREGRLEIPLRQPAHPKVSESMVRKLDGQILPALNVTPASGERYDGFTDQWQPESDTKDQM